MLDVSGSISPYIDELKSFAHAIIDQFVLGATTTRANPVDPPTRFEFIVPGADDASAREDAFPRGAAAAPGSRDAPTTAQHRARWSKAPSDEWWLASAGEAGFVRVQRFDATWAERRLEQLERLHAPAAARNKESEEKNRL